MVKTLRKLSQIIPLHQSDGRVDGQGLPFFWASEQVTRQPWGTCRHCPARNLFVFFDVSRAFRARICCGPWPGLVADLPLRGG